MRKTTLVFLALALCTQFLQAQDSLRLLNKISYKIKVKTITGDTFRGYLKLVTDSSVTYSLANTTYGTAPTLSDKMLHYSVIKKIHLRRSGKTGRAIATGAGIGAATGAIIGLASGDDPPNSFFRLTAGEKAAGLGLFLGASGALVGALSGIAWRKYEINGRKEMLALLRMDVQKKSFGKPDSGNTH